MVAGWPGTPGMPAWHAVPAGPGVLACRPGSTGVAAWQAGVGGLACRRWLPGIGGVPEGATGLLRAYCLPCLELTRLVRLLLAV
jgi:hypothetical protein